jgi:hypothetical protein
MLGQWTLRHPTVLVLPCLVVVLAFILSPWSSSARGLPSLTRIKGFSTLLKPSVSPPSIMPKAPVYFFSHGGASDIFHLPVPPLFKVNTRA